MPNAAGECNSRVAGRIDTGLPQHDGHPLGFRRRPVMVPACREPAHRPAATSGGKIRGLFGCSRPQKGNGAFGGRKPGPHF
jgi:hypothetical protein